MPDPVSGVLAGASIASGVSQHKSAKKAAKAQTKASNQATELSREQFERGIQEVSPFKNAGLAALPGLTSAANEPIDEFSYRDPSQFLNEYFQSPEFQALNAQASDQIFRNRSATGGLRSGGSNVDLANIAPMLGINALQRVNQQDASEYSINQGARADQFNRLYGLANMGANVLQATKVLALISLLRLEQTLINSGNAMANMYGQQANAIGGAITGLGSAYLGHKMGYFDKANSGNI